MRYGIVTETYPPEINGVALTVQGLEQGLRDRGHEVELVRPRQTGEADDPDGALLVRGAALPRYPGLKFGLPATTTLRKRWQTVRPDAIYVATEGPLGWSALRAARQLGIPAATGFHTRFDDYMRDYGAPWLQGVALRWMRRFHNSAQATLVPTLELQRFLQGERFDNVVRLARAVDTRLFDPARRDRDLRAQWGVGDGGVAAIYVGRIAAEKNLPLAVRAFRALQARRPEARFVWVGDGPAREQLQRENPDFIFCGVQRGEDLARHFASGDLFVLSPQDLRPGGVSELKLQMIEADRVCNPHEAPNSPVLHDGVVLQNGVPVGCWVRNVHPGDVSGLVLPQWTYYAYFGAETGRRRVLHVWNDKERPGQVRGAPYLAPILEPLKQMERYGSAELMAAVVSAMLTVFIERDKDLAEGGDESPLGEADAGGNIQLGNAAVVDLLPGEKANMANPLRPNANFDPFFVAWAKQVGAALELPLDELLLHYQSSYSAARAAMLQAWRFYTSRRWQLVQQFCQPVYALAVDEAVAMGRLRLPGYGDPIRRRAYLRAIWIGPARGAMDELKEAQAAGKRIEIGVSNEAMETAAMQGEDWRGVYAQRRLEVARRRADGLYTPPGSTAPAQAPDPVQSEQTA